MLKWLKAIVKSVGKSKFWGFLMRVFDNIPDNFIEKNYKSINESVELAEGIGNWVHENRIMTIENIIQQVFIRYAVEITEHQVDRILCDKGEGKFKLAYDLSKQKIKSNGIDFVEDVIKQSLQLAIQMYVVSAFGKK